MNLTQTFRSFVQRQIMSKKGRSSSSNSSSNKTKILIREVEYILRKTHNHALHARNSQAKVEKGGTPTATSEGNSDVQSPISVSAKNGDLLISIQVRPGAKFTCVTVSALVNRLLIRFQQTVHGSGSELTQKELLIDVSTEAVSLQISAPPVDGEANTAIVKFFSELLKLKKTEVDLRGSKSRQKTVVISSKNVTPSSIMETLKSSVGEKF